MTFTKKQKKMLKKNRFILAVFDILIKLVSVLYSFNGFVTFPGGDNIVHCAHTVHDVTEEFSHTNCNRKKMLKQYKDKNGNSFG